MADYCDDIALFNLCIDSFKDYIAAIAFFQIFNGNYAYCCTLLITRLNKQIKIFATRR